MKAGFILKPFIDKNLKKIFFYVKEIFEKKGIEVEIDLFSAKSLSLLGKEFNSLCKDVDFLVALGGDGTLISVARRSIDYQKPIMGINAGKLGFLTDINPDNIDSFLDKFLNNEYRIDKRMVIKVELDGNVLFAFNDVVISKEVISSMIKVRVDTQESYLNTYYGDGLIISTPTGSTAYNLSAGGPVVYPLMDSFILTPICPHSLTQRSIVLPSNFSMHIDILDSRAKLIIDGQEIFNIEKQFSISKSDKSVQLIHRVERNYFDVLREKLNWGI